MNGSQDLLRRIIWIRGIPPIDFWVRRDAMMGRFVKEHDLKPIDTSGFEIEGFAAGGVEMKAERAAAAIRRPPFPGGMRIAHLHFKGDVFVLTEQHWQAFSGAVIKDLQAKISKVSAVSFDEMRDVAEGIDRIG